MPRTHRVAEERVDEVAAAAAEHRSRHQQAQSWIYRPCVLNIAGAAVSTLPTLYADAIGEVFKIYSEPISLQVSAPQTSITLQFSPPKGVILNTLQPVSLISSITPAIASAVVSASVVTPELIEVVISAPSIAAGTLSLTVWLVAMRFPHCHRLAKPRCRTSVQCGDCGSRA
jgi:hypothetical protein